MGSINETETAMRREVERLFDKISAKRGDLCTNPVTGGEFVYGFDPIRWRTTLSVRAKISLAMVPLTPRDFLWSIGSASGCDGRAGRWITSPANMRGAWYSIQRQSASIF